MYAAFFLLFAAAPPGDDLEAGLRRLAATLGRPDSLKHEAERAREALKTANARSSLEWAALAGKADWERFRAGPTQALDNLLYHRNEDWKPELKVRRTIEREGFRVEPVTFLSRTGLLVTATLYSPSKPGKAMPGLILVHSHHAPKSEGELQDMGAMWSRAGCVVLVLDLLGHGERRQHPFAAVKDFPKPFRVSRQDYYSRHTLAIQAETAGMPLIGWFVRDIHSAHDVLAARPGVDPKKIVYLGGVAGGGDPVAAAAALRADVFAAVVFNFGGPQPETRYPLPDDAEATFNYAGGGSWETTRNLGGSAAEGYLPWVIVSRIAPRRLVYAHEFSWDEARDPVWKRLKQIYAWYGVPGNLKAVQGTGTLSGKSPEASHCNNIGPVHRKGINAAFKAWLGIDAVEAKPDRLPAADLACGVKGPALHDVIVRAGKPVEAASGLFDAWRNVLQGVTDRPLDEDRSVTFASTTLSGVTVQTATIDARRDVYVTLLLPPGGRRPLTVLFGQGRARALLARRAGEVAGLLRKGEALAVLRARPGIDPQRVRLWGDGVGPANGAKHEAPFDHAQPPHADPLGAHVAILAALTEPGVIGVRARGGLVSWWSLLESRAVHFPYDNVLPGALTAPDWAEVCEAVRLPIRLEALADGRNRKVPLEEAKRRYAKARNVTVSE